MYDPTLRCWPSLYLPGHNIDFAADGPDSPITTSITIMRPDLNFPTIKGKVKHATYEAAQEAARAIIKELQAHA
jgi:hypothetical protein